MEVHPCVDALPLPQEGALRWTQEAAFPAGGSFYGTFTVEAGTWITTLVRDVPVGTDVVIRLWNEDGSELLASTDEHLPIIEGFDGVMYHYVPTERTYCIELLEYDVWAGGTSKARTERSFRLTVVSVPDFWGANAPVIEDRGDNETTETAQRLDLDAIRSGGVMLGRLESADDRDVYRFEGVDSTAFDRAVALSLPGPGDASSFGWGAGVEGRVTVLAADGSTILASNTFSNMAATCNQYNHVRCGMAVPERVGETYFVVVEAEGGSEDFSGAAYSAFTASQIFDPVLEGVDEGANDLPSQPVVVTPDPIAQGTGAPIWGELDDQDDVDWWRLDELPGAEVHLWCGSSFFGSGVEALTIEAYAVNDLQSPVRTQMERPDATIRWGSVLDKGEPDVSPLPPDSYLFRVSASSLRADYASKSYQCYLAQVEQTAADRR